VDKRSASTNAHTVKVDALRLSTLPTTSKIHTALGFIASYS